MILKKQNAITMDYFLEEVGKVAEEMDEEYYSASVEIVHEDSDTTRIELRGYVNGTSHETGSTVNEVCALLRREEATEKTKEVIL
jgi:hypothetical protein